MATKRFIDRSGREVRPGDVIIYGHALGRSAGIQYGKVIDIRYKREERYDYTTKTSSHEDVASAAVQGVDLDWSWSKREPRLMKRGTLAYGDRTLVVTREQVPDDVWELLKEVEVNNDV